MEQAPFSFKTSLTKAEENAHKVLCGILGLQDGMNAHRGYNPGKINVFVFAIGGIRNGEVAHSRRCEHFHFHGMGEVWFDVREQVQEFIMRMYDVTPVHPKILDGTNLTTLRLATDGVGPVDLVDILPRGEKEAVPCWHALFNFDVVFYTGKRPEG